MPNGMWPSRISVSGTNVADLPFISTPPDGMTYDDTTVLDYALWNRGPEAVTFSGSPASDGFQNNLPPWGALLPGDHMEFSLSPGQTPPGALQLLDPHSNGAATIDVNMSAVLTAG